MKQSKVLKLYDFISENLYLCLPDLKAGGREFNSTLLFEILSVLNSGKQLLFGEYGYGKTSSAELVAALLAALPVEVMLASELRGHAEQTEEKMIARPDLGELNKGIEKVIWGYFVLNPVKIADEFNRLPAAKQNILLDGIDRGNWKYLSMLVKDKDFALFGTCNYEDLGNTALIEPLLDRFDIATESKKPGLPQMASIKDIPDDVKALVDDAEIADRIFALFNSKEMSYSQKRAALAVHRDEFRQRMREKNGIELLAADELADAKKEISAVQFSESADMFYVFVLAELASCHQFGMKRANTPCLNGCHFSDYGCGKAKNGLSVRTALAVAKYARSLAWIAGKERVTVEELENVLPYAIWHKLKLNDSFASQFKADQKTDPEALYAAKKLVAAIKHRFAEQEEMLTNFICLMRDGKVKEAAEYAAKADHPVYKELLRKSWVI